MGTNNVNSLFNRQYGFSSWKDYDFVLHRFQCNSSNADTPLFDTPVFACKSAQKQGNENMVGMANEDGRLVLLNCESKERFGTTAHNNAIFDLAWMFDQMKIVTASGDHTSKLYDCGNGDIQEVRMFCGHTRSVKTVTFRKDDSSVFASGSRDGNIVLWDTRTDQNSFIGKADRTIMNSHAGKEVNTPSKNKKKSNVANSSGIKSVTGLVFQDTNTLISCGAGDGIIKIWDIRKHYTISKKDPLPKYTIPYMGKTTKNGFSNLIIDNRGVKLYANCLDNTIYCYNVSSYNNEPVTRYTGHQNSTFYIKSSLSKDGSYLVSGSSDENAYIWNLNYAEPIVKLSGHTAEVTCVAWCNSKATPSLITCSDDMSHRIWTIGNEKDNDCSTGNPHFKAEILPLPPITKPTRKRLLNISTDFRPKKIIWQCKNCQRATITDDLCENCVPASLKRKADCDLWNEPKRFVTDFGPRRLFGHLSRNFGEGESIRPLDGGDDSAINLKSLNTALDSFKSTSRKELGVTTSPTVNLPNFVVDGTAPHLNFSPPQRKSQDWLTKMRIERNLRQEMLEKTSGPNSPKMSKLDLTPRSSKKSSWTTPKSPLLRFFKVTNSNSKSDTMGCSPKSHNCNFLGTNKSCEQLSQ